MGEKQAKQYSIRKDLIGLVADIVKDAGFTTTNAQEIIAELSFLLSEYREEDQALFPNVYLIDGEKATELLNILAPSSQRVSLDEVATDDCCRTILKNTAALAFGGWSVYIELHASTVKYGLFRDHALPTSISASESLQDLSNPLNSVLLVRNCASKSVEIIDGKGEHHELSLTSFPNSGKLISNQIRKLATTVVSGLCEAYKVQLLNYFERTISSICRESHGILLAIVESQEESVPTALSDGVKLITPIDMGSDLVAFHQTQSSHDLCRVQHNETLLRGMLLSDGITVLSTNAKILAFRVFVKPNTKESEQLATIQFRGGARTRALELMKLRLYPPITAFFFQSQDGRTEFVTRNES